MSQKRKQATVLCDYNFTTSTQVDENFQFVDCTDVDFEELARNIRAGILEVEHEYVVIMIGNQACIDNFTNVVHPVTLLINAIFDRFGCVNKHVWVTSLLPRPSVSIEIVDKIRKINKSIVRSVRTIEKHKRYP